MALILTVTWTNPGAFMFLDDHTVSLNNTSAQLRVEGFATVADCQAYQPLLPTPTLNALTPLPLAITKRSCVRYTAP